MQKPKPVAGKDVASSTAIGVASRFGLARRKAKLAEGAALGSSENLRQPPDRGVMVTALFVVITLLGTLAIMLKFGH